jgi:mRNA interferase YafQ
VVAASQMRQKCLMRSTPKPSSSKRTNLPRRPEYTKQFLKDWQRLTHSGRYNMRQIKEVMVLLIANDAPLTAEWHDHELCGKWISHRECHVGGDFLLIYHYNEAGDVIFVRSGTHAELFE